MGDAGSEKKVLMIWGMPWYGFAILAVLLYSATAIGKLPTGLTGAFGFMIVTGTIFYEIGVRIPYFNSYLGGGTILCIFGPAFMVYFKLFPEYVVKQVDVFMKGQNFFEWFIAALVVGSIFGMSRRLLINAAIRYLPALLGGVIAALLGVGLVGWLIGYGFNDAILYIGVPIMGGGLGAGAVPLSKIYGDAKMLDPSVMLAVMVPAVALGNALSIVAAALLNHFGKTRPKLSGGGQMLHSMSNEEADQSGGPEEQIEVTESTYGTGLVISCCLFCMGPLLALLIKGVHPYALTIFTVAVIKVLGIVPHKYEQACARWYKFMVTNMNIMMLTGVGMAYTNLGEVADALSPQYLVLVTVTVVGAIIGSGLVGHLVGFYAVEASITAGLCMANMGGTGDVAVLNASNRMELMPFAQISSRIGGAVMLVIASILLTLLN